MRFVDKPLLAPHTYTHSRGAQRPRSQKPPPPENFSSATLGQCGFGKNSCALRDFSRSATGEMEEDTWLARPRGQAVLFDNRNRHRGFLPVVATRDRASKRLHTPKCIVLQRFQKPSQPQLLIETDLRSALQGAQLRSTALRCAQQIGFDKTNPFVALDGHPPREKRAGFCRGRGWAGKLGGGCWRGCIALF